MPTEQRLDSARLVLCAGAAAGVLEAVTTMPLEVTKTRIQISSSMMLAPGGIRLPPPSTLASMQMTVATDGVRGLFAGLPIMLVALLTAFCLLLALSLQILMTPISLQLTRTLESPNRCVGWSPALDGVGRWRASGVGCRVSRRLRVSLRRWALCGVKLRQVKSGVVECQALGSGVWCWVEGDSKAASGCV
jgi:hypothetical protein